jgi:hypothetical protein
MEVAAARTGRALSVSAGTAFVGIAVTTAAPDH